MKQTMMTAILLAFLLGCERNENRPSDSYVTSFDAVEILHLALRDSCDGRCELKFTSALTQQTGRIARGGSYWTITASSIPEDLEIAIVSPDVPGAIRINTGKGSVWIGAITDTPHSTKFLKLWNMPTMEAWIYSLRDHAMQQEEAESWESPVPTATSKPAATASKP